MVKSTVEISQNFVGFSEYMNFESTVSKYNKVFRKHKINDSYSWPTDALVTSIILISNQIAINQDPESDWTRLIKPIGFWQVA